MSWPRCEKTLRLNSFPVRCINKWNTLSEDIVCSDTVFKFKTRLDKVLLPERYILSEIYWKDILNNRNRKLFRGSRQAQKSLRDTINQESRINETVCMIPVCKHNYYAVDGTPSQIPAFSLLTLTLGSWLHKMLLSTLHILWPMDLGCLKWLCRTVKEMDLKEKYFLWLSPWH